MNQQDLKAVIFNNPIKNPSTVGSINGFSVNTKVNNTGELLMNSTSTNYINESQASPIKNVIPFKSNLSAIDETHLIKEGVYEATLNTWETTISFGLPRLILYFTITECGEHFGKTFRKFYYVKKLNGKPKIKGKFIAKCSGSFLKHWYKVFPKIKRLRPDRVPMQNLNGIVIKVKVRTVKKDFEGDKLPEQMQYSVVDELLEI